MGKRRQASPAPLEREAKDIFFARLFFSFFCVRLFFCARRLRAHASRVRRLEAVRGQARARGAARQRARGLVLRGSETVLNILVAHVSAVPRRTS